MKALEQLYMLGLFAGEIEDRADLPVVAEQMRPRMIDDERKNELFDDPEDTKILMGADLVEDPLLERVQALDRRGAGQALGHKVAREIEFLVLSEHVVELPLGPERRGQRRFVIKIMIHLAFPSDVENGGRNGR